MKKNIWKYLGAIIIIVFGLLVNCHGLVYAEGEEEAQESSEETKESEKKDTSTNISVTPVSKVLQLSSDSTYDDSFTVTNNGDLDMKIETYAAPYFYVYSEEEDTYKLGFNTNNNYTQIARWITFKSSSGNYEERPTFTIKPKEALTIEYRIKTPNNIPPGGQYAVIFAHTLTSTTSASGIKTEASPGIVVFGRSLEGESVVSSEISNLEISSTRIDGENNAMSKINAKAKVKNNGNIDFNAVGVLKVSNIFGGTEYETPSNRGRISVIPDSELTVSDYWDETPGFGLFKVSWTVTVGEETETVEQFVFINLSLFIIIIIILLTILSIWIIIRLRRRKERRSRLAV